jgi:ParB family chromosome partitioning protein
MKKVNELLKSGAANIASSLGIGAPPLGVFPADRPAGPDRYAGRTRGNTGEMAIENIVPDPDQPRKEFDPEELESLAESLKAHGQLQPVRVRWHGDYGKWVVVAGERRYRAALRAGLAKLACVFVEDENVSAALVLEEQLVENCLRCDLKPIEQAQAFRRLMDLTGMTGKDVAQRLKIHPTTVTRTLQLLDLPPQVQEKIETGAIAPSVGIELSKLPDEREQIEVADRIVTEKLTRSEATKAVGDKRKKSAPKTDKVKARTEKVKEFTHRTDERASVTVSLKKAGTMEDVRRALEETLRRLPVSEVGQGGDAQREAA